MLNHIMLIFRLRMARFGRTLLSGLFLCSFVGAVIAPLESLAQVPKKRIQKRINVRNYQESSSSEPSRFSLAPQFSDIFDSSIDSDLYDPRGLAHLRYLKDQAQPWWDPDGIDPDETREVVQRVLVIRSAQSVVPVIKRSDLKETYRDMKQAYRSVTDTFRYSVQDQGNSILISKEHQGEKLIELNLELDVNTGFDPALNIGDDLRLRYDWLKATPLLEFEINF